MSASRTIFTDHEPFGEIENELRENPSSEPSRLKFSPIERGVPTLFNSALPLSLISVPVMSTEPPATGLPEMGSISNWVSDRTVSLNTDELVGSKLDDPLKKNCIWTIPRG